jgi:predicted DNA helicase
MNLKISQSFQDIKRRLQESKYQIHQNNLFNDLCAIHDYILKTKDTEAKNEFVVLLHDIFIEIFMPLRDEKYIPYPNGTRVYFGSNILLQQTISAIFDLNVYSKIWLKDISDYYTLFSADYPHYNAVPKTDFSKATAPISIHKIKNLGLVRSAIFDHLKIHVDPDKPLPPQNDNPLDKYIYTFASALYEESKIKNRFFQNMKYKEFNELNQDKTAILNLTCLNIEQQEIYDEENETISWIITLKLPHNDHLSNYPLFKDNPCLYIYTSIHLNDTFNPLKANYLGKKTHLNEENNLLTLRITKPLRTHENIPFTLVLRPDNDTYDREKKALSYFKEKSSPQLIQEIVLKQKSSSATNFTISSYCSLDLNPTQRQAVQSSFSSPNLFCIHGPAGTGKTKVCTEILLQQLYAHPTSRILVTSASNEATDNLLNTFKKVLPEKLHPLILRIGEDKTSIHSLNYKIKHSQDYQQKIISLQQQIDQLTPLIETLRTERKQKEQHQRQLALEEKELNDEFNHPSPNTDLTALFERKDLIEKKIQQITTEMIDLRYKIQTEEKNVYTLKEQINQNREDLKKSYLTQKPIILFSTNNHSDVLRKFKLHFDLLLIDEVTQSTEPSVLIPLSQSEKLIMAGDHHQLPPTVFLKNKNYDDDLDPEQERIRINSYQILSLSIFERLFNHVENIFLNQQYRMNPLLIEFLNNTIYSQTPIICSDLVTKNHYTKSLFNTPLLFINHNYPEVKSYVSEEFSPSKAEYHNPAEVTIIHQLIKKYLDSGISPNDIGIISPYTAQVRELNKTLESYNLSAKTIDNFQGQEKKIIILSLVRSNNTGTATQRLGFLVDERRFNVALTRFQYELIIIGNEQTLSSYTEYFDIYDNKTKPIYYKSLINYIKQKGLFLTETNLHSYLQRNITFEEAKKTTTSSEINKTFQHQLQEKLTSSKHL